jgi:hypothetical protein
LLPSFTLTKATLFCFRAVRTQPLTVTASPIRSEVQNLVLILGVVVVEEEEDGADDAAAKPVEATSPSGEISAALPLPAAATAASGDDEEDAAARGLVADELREARMPLPPASVGAPGRSRRRFLLDASGDKTSGW